MCWCVVNDLNPVSVCCLSTIASSYTVWEQHSLVSSVLNVDKNLDEFFVLGHKNRIGWYDKYTIHQAPDTTFATRRHRRLFYFFFLINVTHRPMIYKYPHYMPMSMAETEMPSWRKPLASPLFHGVLSSAPRLLRYYIIKREFAYFTKRLVNFKTLGINAPSSCLCKMHGGVVAAADGGWAIVECRGARTLLCCVCARKCKWHFISYSHGLTLTHVLRVDSLL